MGFLAQDFVPLGAYGPTAVTPTSKDVMTKVFTVNKTDTTSTVKLVLPADASIVGVKLYGATASNAGTSATVSISVASGGSTISSGTYDVKTSGAVTGEVTMSGLPNIQPVPLVGDLIFSASYAEVGTASSTGTAWNVAVTFIR